MRQRIIIRGIVQGVGFRPFIYNLAHRFTLAGFVCNRTGDVLIEIEGPSSDVESFKRLIQIEAPSLSLIESMDCEEIDEAGDTHFVIQESESVADELVFISPDLATCEDCLREFFDRTDRRYHYPFLNCTNCGPRLTIIQSAPYDRERTTMSAFTMCESCQAEYDDPTDRRFHAQPTACSKCGPHLSSLPESDSPLLTMTRALVGGKIVALKGLGGYHLCCDARSEETVLRLRQRKHREEKPFAIMLRDLDQVRNFCEVNEIEAKMLTAPSRPIVLLKKQSEIEIAEAVAPRNRQLGVMLPSTPWHHFLMHQAPFPIVMTSGNLTDEPIAYQDDGAIQRLGPIADVMVTHNRPIHLRCDDSVSRCVAGEFAILRRARGFAPSPIRLPFEIREPILALGGQMKSTFALGRDRHAILSHHLGELGYLDAFQAYQQTIEHYQDLFNINPQLLAHDLHPDYASTRYAKQRASRLLGVQHHHAHLASCMAEHGLHERTLGVIFDGTGFGTDETIWGGEFLVGDYHDFDRVLHLRPVLMIGGEKAVREPWRMALSHLLDAGLPLDHLCSRVDPQSVRVVEQMWTRKLNTVPTSSMGRLFDAVAVLAGLREAVSFEGQAAMDLEQVSDAVSDHIYPFEVGSEIDTRPMIRAIMQDRQQSVDASVIGRRFHSTVVQMIVQGCERVGVENVALSGGCFMNALLTEETSRELTQRGFRVYRQCQVPCNDGGLSLGQLAIAAAFQS